MARLAMAMCPAGSKRRIAAARLDPPYPEIVVAQARRAAQGQRPEPSRDAPHSIETTDPPLRGLIRPTRPVTIDALPPIPADGGLSHCRDVIQPSSQDANTLLHERRRQGHRQRAHAPLQTTWPFIQPVQGTSQVHHHRFAIS